MNQPVPTMPAAAYLPGLTSVDDDSEPVSLPVDGELPPWLAGELIRNGPAKFDTPTGGFRHWFDGQAMLHRFAFADGRVEYRSRFLDTRSLRAARDGRIDYFEFATDPCRAIFSRFFTRFRRRFGGNANVNITWMDGNAVALTEVPLAVRFDPETLATLDIRGYEDDVRGQVSTAHPHQAPGTGDLVNYVLNLGPRSEYQVYRQHPDGMRRELIGSYSTRTPAYLHSFGITGDYAVLVLFPFVVNPLALLLRDRPFIANYRWRPELGAQFVVIGLADGAVRGVYRADPFFAFHHINSFVDGDELVVDTSAYDDASVIDSFYLDRLRAGRAIGLAHPTRHRIHLDNGTVRAQRLSDEALELPRINYGANNGRPYRYCYGVGTRDDDGRDFFNQLVKLDVDTGRTDIWRQDGTYPGEPVFVAAPDAVDEDDGVILSVVLDAEAGNSFLVVLDARSWRELARATVPHAVPFGFHGQFARR